MLKILAGSLLIASSLSFASEPPGWETLPSVKLKAGLRAFWNVKGGDDPLNEKEASARGFELVDLINTFQDYVGKQKENIQVTLKGNERNPWSKPSFFEKIVRRNIQQVGTRSILVHDIEFELEQDAGKAWHHLPARKASATDSEESFRSAYYKEWGSWFSLPCLWAKEIHPRQPVGIYGPQPFGREYWGLSDPRRWSAFEKRYGEQGMELWKSIDPFVDFYAISTYFFHESPDSIYYMAANIEENHARTRRFGDKPIYPYVWLRYHEGGPIKDRREIASFLAEAAAVIPFFTGGRGVVLWGYEPGKKGQYYERLPDFVRSLARISALSERIGRAKLANQIPSKELWWRREPLIRKLEVSPEECIFMAINPWQAENASKTVLQRCGSKSIEITMRGRRTSLFHVTGAGTKEL